MAGQRKLLSEIDRTLKKVSEGVDVFNDIWEKVYSATTQSQKEKHESDLKKEIKKLQRFRDQIKNWIGNSDVKDKRPLVDARKLIEQKMEEFKVCEKETKTKAYSKEGLAQIERLDPAERAKQSTRNWIQDCLTQLNEQMEAFDCDLERLQTQSKGRNKNKQEVQDLETALARHKWHILKLEQVTRLLDNDAIDPSVVDELKEDIEYYLEANQV
jgi:CCR4-NOT transcription complex subunit 3